MIFPPFGVKEILAALADGQGRQMTETDKMGFQGAPDGSIIVEMADPGALYTVVVSPTSDGQMAKFSALDAENNEFVLVYRNKWYAI